MVLYSHLSFYQSKSSVSIERRAYDRLKALLPVLLYPVDNKRSTISSVVKPIPKDSLVKKEKRLFKNKYVAILLCFSYIMQIVKKERKERKEKKKRKREKNFFFYLLSFEPRRLLR